MTDGRTGAEAGRGTRKGLPFRILAAAVIIILLICLLFKLVLLTGYPAEALGSLLSDYTGRKVTVGGVAWFGGALNLDGITIENPPGFQERNMLSVRLLRVAPELAAVLTAGRRLALVELQGVKLDLEKNSAGEWNFARLLGRFRPAKKAPSREIFIKRLVLRDMDLLVNGRAIHQLGLDANDLSTRGTTESRLVLSLRDADGNPLLLTAEGRMGASPDLRGRLQAPRLSLARLVTLPRGLPMDLEKAGSSIDLSAELKGPLMNARGRVGFDGLGLRLGDAARLIRGGIGFSGSYDTARDRAVLERADLTVSGLASLTAAGSMDRARKDGSFILTLSHEPIGLAGLLGMLPEKGRRDLTLDGTIVSRGIRLEGSRAKGITAGRADISLRSVRLARHGRVLLSRGGADLSVNRLDAGWVAAGRFFSPGSADGALIESLDAPFTARLSPRFRPERLDFPAIGAAIAGGRLTGSFGYLPAARQRFTGDCAMRNLPLVSLNRYLGGAKAHFTSGSGSASASLAGGSFGDFAGRVSVTLSSAAGTAAGRKFSLGKTTVVSGFRRGAGGFTADGRVAAAEGVLDGRPFTVSSELSLAENLLKVGRAELSLAGGLARIGAATVRLPSGSERKAHGGIPVAATVAGVEFRKGELAIGGGSGELSCRYYSAGEDSRLEGGGSFSVGSLSYRDRKAASLTGRLSFGGRNISARAVGESLGGKFEASVTTAPFSTGKETTFSARLREQQLERISPLLPENKGLRLSGGRADVELDGSWERSSGMRGRFSLTGRNVSLQGAGNRTLMSGFGLVLDSRVAGPDLLLKDAVLRREGGPVLRASGAVKRFAAAEREGSLTFSMASTPLNSLLDAFANSLPRNLQEATGGGTCDLEGSVAFKGKAVTVDGGLNLKAASLEMPSQKVLVADIDGRIPFSLAYPRRGAERKPAGLTFSRENYAGLLRSFGQGAGTGSRLRLGSARFGALETGEMTFFITSRPGSLEIAPLRVSLYDGYLTGNGFFQYGNGFSYGADLLLHDLSLRQLCDSFPKIKGYMSGRVDGVVSLLNSKGGAEQAAGYVNLWTRSGKGEKMLVSKEFLQKLAGKKLKGFLFQNDRAYDNAEIIAYLRGGFLTFERLDISHTNLLGMKDLSVTVAPVQNRIALEHLLESIREAAARGKGQGEGEAPPVQTDLKWLE